MARRELTVGALVVALALVSERAAMAAFDSATPPQSLSVATLTVAPVTGLAASSACGSLGSGSATATLTWTATTTSRATSYTVRRTTTGVYSDVAEVPIGTTSYTNTVLLPATTYSYVVRTNVNGWYADSTSVSVTTPLLCL